mgnify:CR=1 FL=1
MKKPYNRPAGVGNAFPPLVAGALWTSPAGLRVDGPMGRRFLRGLSLTAAMPLRVVVGRL